MKKEARKSQQEVIVTVLLILVGIAAVVTLSIVISKISKGGVNQAENNTVGIMGFIKNATNPPATTGSGCSNECSPNNSIICSNNYLKNCGYYDPDNCLDIAPSGTLCPYGCTEGSSTCSTNPGAGTPTDPIKIGNCTLLQDINKNLAANYVLVGDIDCSLTSGWNCLVPYCLGFIPISGFSGTLDGEGHIIDGLNIGSPMQIGGSQFSGFFATTTASALIKDVGIVNAKVYPAANYGGILVGENKGTIKNSYTTGSIQSVTVIVGGLVGSNQGEINDSYSLASVSGMANLGGITGSNSGTGSINRCYAIGSISASMPMFSLLGGLSGNNQGKIVNSFSTGILTNYAGNGTQIGASVGDNEATITNIFYNNRSAPPFCYMIMNTPNDTGCTAIQNNESYFKGLNVNASQPMASWDFTNVWKATSGYPVLRWQ